MGCSNERKTLFLCKSSKSINEKKYDKHLKYRENNKDSLSDRQIDINMTVMKMITATSIVSLMLINLVDNMDRCVLRHRSNKYRNCIKST